MVQNPDAPESENKEPVVTTEKEEPVPVEAIERDVLEEDDDFEEFKEDRTLPMLVLFLPSVFDLCSNPSFLRVVCCRLERDPSECG